MYSIVLWHLIIWSSIASDVCRGYGTFRKCCLPGGSTTFLKEAHHLGQVLSIYCLVLLPIYSLYVLCANSICSVS